MRKINYELLRSRMPLTEEAAADEAIRVVAAARAEGSDLLDLTALRVRTLPPLNGLGSVKEVDLRFSRLDSLAALSELPNIEALYITGFGLGSLEELDRLTSLKILSVEYGDELQFELELAALTHLTKLELKRCPGIRWDAVTFPETLTLLNVSGSEFDRPEILARLSRLQALTLDHNPVSSLAEIANLVRLQHLSLRSTSIESLAPLIDMDDLSELHLGHTNISDLRPIARMRLRVLTLNNSSVTTLAPLKERGSLRSLSIAETGIEDLCSLKQCKGLETLNAARAGIRDLTFLSELCSLKALRLDSNQIEDLAPLAGLRGLEKLDLDENPVRSIDALSSCPALHSLSISRTKVSDLRPIGHLIELADFNCSHTPVADLGPLKDLSRLKILDCSDTRVEDLTPVSKLSCEMLDISETRIRDLTPLRDVNSLSYLECSGTQLNEWPLALFSLPKLTQVYAANARIGNIPKEELSSHTGDNCLPNLRAYFDDLAAGAKPLERVKLIVLGNGQVGKTQLRRWLLNSEQCPSPYDPQVPTTHGIDVLRGPIAVPTESGGTRQIDASLWDFGGQDIYHGTHGLFMRTRAIFILCWSAEQEDSREHLLGGLVHQNQPIPYWVTYIRQLAGPRNPLLIVQTQCDTPAADQPQRFAGVDLIGFEMAKFLQFSAKTGRGGAALREAIADASSWAEAEHGVPLIGAGRLEVMNQLEAWRSEDAARPAEERVHKFLSQERFAEMCEAAGGISSRAHFLNFLHHAGVVFYRAGLFDDRIILDQNWALQAIYTAFDRERCYPVLRANRGRFSAELIGSLAWQEHSLEEQRLFLSLMESCGIAFPHSEAGEPGLREYIAPDLLPDRASVEGVIESRWHGRDEPVCARMRFSLLHIGLMRQILARVGREARLNAQYWRTGLLFFERNRQSDAIIEAVADAEGWGGEIVIQCRSGQASVLLDLLVKEVREIAEQVGLQPDNVDCDVDPAAGAAKADTPPAPLEFAAPPRAAPRWYVSYAWGDTTPDGKDRAAKVDDLCEKARARGIEIIRDRDSLQNGDSIRRFMQDLVAGDRLIIILSDKYLKSANCMFELHQSWIKQGSDPLLFAQAARVFALPSAKIGSPATRGAVAQHWDESMREAQKVLKFLGARDLADFNLMRHYALGVGDILYGINDTISPRDWDEFLDYAFAA